MKLDTIRFIIVVAVLVFINALFYACAGGGKRLRDFQQVRGRSKTFFWPKSKTEKIFYTQTCSDRKRNGDCKEWKKQTLDVCNKTDDWNFIHDSGMILINRNTVF